MAAILMMLSKIGYFNLLLVYFSLVSENEKIISAHGIIKKFLPRGSNYAINVVM